jgi:glutathione peroxidase
VHDKSMQKSFLNSFFRCLLIGAMTPFVSIGMTACMTVGSNAVANENSDFYGFTVKKSDGSPQSLADYNGKVVLVVNVASKCGFTPQYAGLEDLWKKYRDKGLVILGFPCNQFGAQEPGSNQEIQSFCKLKYDVDFPIFSKIDVNGDSADPLYKWLKKNAPGILGTEAIKWNFTKFLVGKNGKVIERYAPTTEPKSLAADIEKALAE